LILALVRPPSHGGPEPETATNLIGRVEPQGFRASALSQGVMAVVHHALQGYPDIGLKSVLEHDYRANAARNALLSRTLLVVLSALEAEGIDAVPFKGPTLAVRAYGGLSERQFSDLDILIPRNAALSACRLMDALGFQRATVHENESAYIRTHNHFKFVRHDDGTLVELHWAFAPPWFSFPLSESQVLRDAEHYSFQGANTRQPPGTQLLRILVGHGSKHCWSKLAWLVDVDRLLSAEGAQIDWARLLHRVERAGGARQMLLALGLCHEVLGTGLVAPVLACMKRQRTLSSLQQAAFDNLIRSMNRPGERSPWGAIRYRERVLFHLSSRERWRDKMPLAIFVAKGRLKDLARH
jgi:hypothetical protein